MKLFKLVLVIFMITMISQPLFAQVPFQPGETFTYDIKKLGLKMGEASLVFNGPESYQGCEVFLITFKASAMNFLDEEKIYLDPESFLPLAVKRDLNIWGKKERITEEYDAAQGRVKIIKEVNGKTFEQILNKDGALDNIYCFIYRYRQDGNLGKDKTMRMNLPTKDVTLRVAGKSRISAAGEVFEAQVIVSTPRQYKVWFGAGPKKIPLRIDGAVGLASTSLILSDYKL